MMVGALNELAEEDIDGEGMHLRDALDENAVTRDVLRAMGGLIEDEMGPGVAFALFVDWRDGKPCSYLSNGNRSHIVTALDECMDKARRREPTLATERGEIPALEAKCAELGKSMAEEDVDVVLFLFTNGEQGETAWFSSMANGRDFVERWVALERVLERGRS
jgi:hypothetical protein